MGYGGKKIAEKKISGKSYNKAKKYFERWGFASIVLFAITPLPMDVIGLIAGGFKYNIKKFFIATMLGKIPRCLIIAYAGSIGLNVIRTYLGF